MKKEFYKLSFVFMMIVFTFSLAFFLGREITLSQQKLVKTTPSESAPFESHSIPKAQHTQREKVNIYKKRLDNPATPQNPQASPATAEQQEIEKELEERKEPSSQDLKLTEPETELETELEVS